MIRGKSKARIVPQENAEAVPFWKDADRMALITSTVLLAVELFKIVMACLLAVVVPQYCDATDPEATDTRKALGSGDCTLEENFINLTAYNKAVLAINFITLGMMILSQWWSWKRERSLIEYLDYDPKLPDSNLAVVLESRPDLQAKVAFHNNRVYISAIAVVVMLLTNTILSCILVFSPSYYNGFRTVTVLISNVLLVFGVAARNMSIVRKDKAEKTASSLVQNVPVAYNVIDADWAASQIAA